MKKQEKKKKKMNEFVWTNSTHKRTANVSWKKIKTFFFNRLLTIKPHLELGDKKNNRLNIMI